MNTPHEISPEHAPQMREWLATRGGAALWRSINLSNPGASWTTPATHADGTPTTKPTWQAANTPERIITSAADVVVITPRLVTRFHVGVRRGEGLSFTLTDGASRKVRAAVEKAGEGAWYAFDYEAQDALIFVPGAVTPLEAYV